MKRLIRLFVSMLVPALILAFATATPAMKHEDKSKDAMAAKAEKGKATLKVLLENDKVRVYEAYIPAGGEAANIARPYRIGRALTSATIERNYADGRKETVKWKAGEVKALGPDTQYIPRNIGKTDFRIYVVEPKSK